MLLTALSPDLLEQLQALNVRESEYAKICNHLQREPNFTELCMFSALWSEHCSYKHSRHLLKTLPVEGPQIVQGPGENAGIVDCGDGLHVAFKVESHNHPTYVEPFQGAATGVGGILRDITTMNARPIGLLNALRFGPLEEGAVSSPKQAGNRYRFFNAIAGIGHFGNCMGIPTVGGDVFFHPSYTGNPLVNAMAIGLMRPEGMMAAGAKGIGNPVVYVGSPTGRDGMGGASFASKALADGQRSTDRPAVQVGDPFLGKLLMEACLEAFSTGAVLSAQDMGAAGLTCATAEMAAKGDLGMSIELDDVPAREEGMLAWEYLSSESQERFLLVVQKGREAEVEAVFKKWDVPVTTIGEVIEDERLIVTQGGKQVVDLPVKLLTDMAPSYAPGHRPTEPESMNVRREEDARAGLPVLDMDGVEVALKQMMATPNVMPRDAVYTQYDRHVQNNTLLASEHNSAGVIELRDNEGERTGKRLASTLDGNPRYVTLEPYRGTLSVVAEAARNIVAVGAKPLAITNNLNFGDPELPDVYYQLYFSVEAMKDACNAFDTPVTGGNVSLYNTNEEGAIIPSPVVGMVGVIEPEQSVVSPDFKQAGDTVVLIGRFKPSLGGSEYQWLHQQRAYGQPPNIDIRQEATILNTVLSAAQKELFQSLQDVSMGGLLCTVRESLTHEGLGLSLNLSQLLPDESLDTLLFGETNGSFIASVSPESLTALTALCEEAEVTCQILGKVTNEPTLTLTRSSESRTFAL